MKRVRQLEKEEASWQMVMRFKRHAKPGMEKKSINLVIYCVHGPDVRFLDSFRGA